MIEYKHKGFCCLRTKFRKKNLRLDAEENWKCMEEGSKWLSIGLPLMGDGGLSEKGLGREFSIISSAASLLH